MLSKDGYRVRWSVLKICEKSISEVRWNYRHLTSQEPLGPPNWNTMGWSRHSPCSCASNRALFCRYQRRFARSHHVPLHRCALQLYTPDRKLRAVMRFRLGCHSLPVNLVVVDRHLNSGRQQGMPRDHWSCTRCSGQTGCRFRYTSHFM